MADEKVDVSKLNIKSLVVGKKQDIWKSLRYGTIFVIILGLGYLIYRGAEALFPKPQKLEQNIVAKKGSNVTLIQKTDSKRWYVFFVEPFVGIRTDTDGEGKAEVGGRLGIRFEF